MMFQLNVLDAEDVDTAASHGMSSNTHHIFILSHPLCRLLFVGAVRFKDNLNISCTQRHTSPVQATERDIFVCEPPARTTTPVRLVL